MSPKQLKLHTGFFNVSRRMNNCFSESFHYDSKLRADAENLYFQTRITLMSLKRNIDSVTDGSSDELHSVYLQNLLKIEVIVAQNQH